MHADIIRAAMFLKTVEPLVKLQDKHIRMTCY
jgi:hypothetical protein